MEEINKKYITVSIPLDEFEKYQNQQKEIGRLAGTIRLHRSWYYVLEAAFTNKLNNQEIGEFKFSDPPTLDEIRAYCRAYNKVLKTYQIANK